MTVGPMYFFNCSTVSESLMLENVAFYIDIHNETCVMQCIAVRP